ncbi:MAG: DUF1048 domain-containing protein [Lachnospiraceae bacterium]
MSNLIKSIILDKKEYKAKMEKVAMMPEEYRFVYEKISSYMWPYAGGDGMDMLRTQYDLIELFEVGIADGKYVLDITGEDVAAFCDELLKSTRKYTDYYRKKLNQSIKKLEMK